LRVLPNETDSIMEFPDWFFFTPELSHRLKSYPFFFGLRFLFEGVGVFSKEERLSREIDNIAETSDTSRIGIFLLGIEISQNSSNCSAIFRSVIPYKEVEPIIIIISSFTQSSHFLAYGGNSR
jgi:hypothetical protein